MVKWLVAIILIHVATFTSASTTQHSHSELGGMAAKALEDHARQHECDLSTLNRTIGTTGMHHST